MLWKVITKYFYMIKYSLKCVEENCNKNEPFDGWCQNSASFDKQIDAGYISCPYCGSLKIRKNLMSPTVKSIKEKTHKITSKNVLFISNAILLFIL